MKLFKHPSKHFSRLVKCRSKDPTRFSMQAVHFDRDLPFAVTTDGHRLYASRELHRTDLAGQTIEGDIYGQHYETLPVRFDFPDWKQVVPRSSVEYAADFTVPLWAKHLREVDTAPVSITWNYLTANIHLGVLNRDESNDAAVQVTFDLRLLAPFAGETVRLLVHSDKSPIAVVEPGTMMPNLGGLLALDWFAIIMPMRAISAVVSSVETPKVTETMPDNVVRMERAE